MKIKFNRNLVGQFWHGTGREECPGSGFFLNLGFLAIDWYSALGMLVFYFWKWSITMEFEEGKEK